MKQSINIAVTYEKGGVGKTTTSVNLASILAERGYKVLLVDLDGQAYATSYFNSDIPDQPTIYEVMTGVCRAKETVLWTGFKNLYLLPSRKGFENIETILIMKTRRQEYTLSDAMRDLESEYDFIILDCPPGEKRIKENAYVFSRYILLPTIPDDNAIQGLTCIAEIVKDLRQFVKPDIEILGLVINMYENNNNKKAYTEFLTEGQDLIPCFKTVIRKNTHLSEARNHHKPINYYKKSAIGNKDYNALCDEILKKIGW